MVGGGIKNGQRPAEAMAHNFKRETTLDLLPERFTLMNDAINLTQWAVQEKISNLHLPFALQLDPDELRAVAAGLEKSRIWA